MKKRMIAFCFSIFVFLFPAISVFGAESEIPNERLLPRVVDEADLLSSSEEEENLLHQLDEISQRQECDIAVVTVNSLEGKSAKSYADDFYNYNGYGFGENRDGVLLLVSMEARDWWISTTGFGITAFTDAGLDYLSNQFLPLLSDGNYAQCFETYANLCDRFLTQAKSGVPYDIDNLPKEPPSFLWIPGALLLGGIISLIILGAMKSGLKTVHRRDTARDYVVANSFHLTNSRDLFLYQHTSRRAKPKNTNSGGGGSRTHTSSSGTRHGGRGGKF